MYAEFTAACQSAKVLYELIKATKEFSNSAQILTAVSEVQQKLMDANAAALTSQAEQATLIERVRELETKLRGVEDWENQMQRYELIEFPTKTLAYKLKPAMANGEPIHYLCPTCADKKKKITLQPSGRQLYCHECKFNIRIEPYS